MDLVVALGNPLKDRFGQLHRAKLTLAQFGAGLVERKLGETHSMILGTLKNVPSRSGALANRASALGRLVTWSSRRVLVIFAAWLNNWTSAVSSWFNLSM